MFKRIFIRLQAILTGREVIYTSCGHCRKVMPTFWAMNGILLNNAEVMAGMITFHAKCWKKMLEENPIDDKPSRKIPTCKF